MSNSRRHGHPLTREPDQAGNRLQTVLSAPGDDRAPEGELSRGGAASEIGLTFRGDEEVLVGQDGKGRNR